MSSQVSLPADLITLINSFNFGVIILDQQRTIVCWNAWMAKHSEFQSEYIEDMAFDELFPELRNQRLHQAIIANLESGLPAKISNILNKSPFPLYAQNKTKTRIQQELSITRLNLESCKEHPCCMININDVSAARLRENALENQVKERKKAEQYLLKRTHQLQSALYVSKAGIFCFNINKNQLFLDDKAAQIIHITEITENALEAFTETLHPEDKIRVIGFLQNAIYQNASYSLDFEYRIISPDDEIQWIAMKGVIDLNSLDGSKFINGVIVDISQHKAHQDLLREKQAAEIANRAKSAFLANMSHELRTPLHGILSFSKLGKNRAETAAPKKLASYFERINQSGQRLYTLLNDLLDLSKIEAGKMEFKFAKHDLQALIKQVINEQHARLDELGIKIKLQFDEAPSIAEMDSVRITQVLLNLLSNAMKYTEPFENITLRIKHHDEMLECLVTDQGMGIPDNEVEKIFEKFQQSSLTADGSGGSGLGLTICKEIIEHHHGYIGAFNNKIKGATFFFQIPYLQPEQIDED